MPFLSSAWPLRVLKLNNNGLGPAGGAVIADALARLADSLPADPSAENPKTKVKSNLRTIICGRNRLEDGSAEAWAAALKAHGTLEEVRMPQNGIRMAGIAALAGGLAANPNLRHLDLQDNTFAAEGGKAFARELNKGAWPRLRVLNLSDCVIGEEGEVSPVVEALSKGLHKELEMLQLQNDNLEAAEFALLAGVVGKLPALKRVEAQWNEVEEDDESVAALLTALRKQGGKLIMNDEEEEEEEEKEEEKEEKEEEKPAVALAAAPTKVEVVAEKAKTTADGAADALAELFEKVSIR